MGKHFYSGIATLTGMMIGAGILALPYALSKVGFFIGALELIIIGIAMLLTNLYLGEVILRTKGDHQLYGLANKYLGKIGGRLMWFAFVLGMYGALAAYYIGIPETLTTLLNISPLTAALWFFGIYATIMYYGINTLAKSQVILNVTKLLLFVTIFLLVTKQSFNFSNLTEVNLKNLFLPYGTILFSYLAFASLPEVKEELRGNWQDYKKIVTYSTIISITAYILFSFLVIGSTGTKTSELATTALSMNFSQSVMILINLFALVTLGTAAIGIGYALKQMFTNDMNINKNAAWFFTITIPATIAIAMKSFSTIISITGAITGGVTGLLIILMYQNAKKKGNRKPEYSLKEYKIVEVILAILFVAAIFLEIISYL